MGDPEERTYRIRRDLSVPPRNAVITALTEAEITESTAPNLPVYEYVDLDALDALLLHRPKIDVSVTFSVPDATVTVRIDGENHVVVEVTGGTT